MRLSVLVLFALCGAFLVEAQLAPEAPAGPAQGEAAPAPKAAPAPAPKSPSKRGPPRGVPSRQGPAPSRRGPQVSPIRQIGKLQRKASNAVVDLLTAQQRAQKRAAFNAARQLAAIQRRSAANSAINQLTLQQGVPSIYVPGVQPIFQQPAPLLMHQPVVHQPVLLHTVPQQPLLQQAPLLPFLQAPQQTFAQPLLGQYGAVAPLSAYELAAVAQQAGVTPFQVAQAISQAQQAPFAITQIADPLGLDPVQLAQLAQQAQGQNVFQLAQQASFGFGATQFQQPLPYSPLNVFQQPYNPLLQQQLGQYSPLAPLNTLSPYTLAATAQQNQITAFELAQAISQAQQAPFAITQIADPLGIDPVQLAQLAQQAALSQQQGLNVMQIAQQATYGFGQQFHQQPIYI